MSTYNVEVTSLIVAFGLVLFWSSAARRNDRMPPRRYAYWKRHQFFADSRLNSATLVLDLAIVPFLIAGAIAFFVVDRVPGALAVVPFVLIWAPIVVRCLFSAYVWAYAELGPEGRKFEMSTAT